MKSTLFSLNTKDFLRGLIVGILTPVFVIVQQSVVAGNLTFDWKAIGIAAIGGFLAYISKNFITDTNKAAQNTIIDAKVAEIKKVEPNPTIAATKIAEVKSNINSVVNTQPTNP